MPRPEWTEGLSDARLPASPYARASRAQLLARCHDGLGFAGTTARLTRRSDRAVEVWRWDPMTELFELRETIHPRSEP